MTHYRLLRLFRFGGRDGHLVLWSQLTWISGGGSASGTHRTAARSHGPDGDSERHSAMAKSYNSWRQKTASKDRNHCDEHRQFHPRGPDPRHDMDG